MSRQRFLPLVRLAGFALALVLVFSYALPASSEASLNEVRVAAGSSSWQTKQELAIYRVFVRNLSDIAYLTSTYDVLEARGKDYLLVLGTATDAATLRKRGFNVVVDVQATNALPQGGARPQTYYNGYRTVVEHYQHLANVAIAHPDLAVVVDYGDSWRKGQGFADGYDLMAICITKLRPGDCERDPDTDKPRFFLMGAIHARELSTSEMAYRWIDYLVDSYNQDPDITALLDYNEMWVVPVVNPDGRRVVESGGNNPVLQRKNLNTTNNPGQLPCTNGQDGVDLNRNADYQWGGASTSTNSCNLLYRGPSAASEPEEQALETLLRQLFRDQRADDITATAPLTTTGTFISLHSYSDLVLFPWGYPECSGTACPANQRTTNDAGLRSFAFRMGYYNNYEVGQPSEVLYAASGTTDDWTYGRLGIASSTFEIGPLGGNCTGFTPPYSCQDSVFWPINRDAFKYAAKVARQPYVDTLGPTTLTPQLSSSRTFPGTPVTLTVTIDDNLYNSNPNSKRRPPVQALTQAEYYVDLPPWAGGTPLPMAAQDGAWNSSGEVAIAQVGGGLSIGRHTLYVRGRDAEGNFGPVTAQWLYIDDPNVTPTATTTTAPSATATAIATASATSTPTTCLCAPTNTPTQTQTAITTTPSSSSTTTATVGASPTATVMATGTAMPTLTTLSSTPTTTASPNSSITPTSMAATATPSATASTSPAPCLPIPCPDPIRLLLPFVQR